MKKHLIKLTLYIVVFFDDGRGKMLDTVDLTNVCKIIVAMGMIVFYTFFVIIPKPRTSLKR
jgi:hypothetical protein